MFAKIRKIVDYIRHYKTNRDLLLMYKEETTFPFYTQDYRNCIKYSNARLESAEQILSRLIIIVHSIEKGLATTEDVRLGFGQPKVLDIAHLCNQYLDLCNDRPFRLCYAIGVLQEYQRMHNEASYTLKEEIVSAINQLVERIGADSAISTQTEQVCAKDYFMHSNADFAAFAASRHSVRDFSGEMVPEDILRQVIELAQTAPSACNRQSARVYAVYDEKKRTRLVDMQNHQRGFADNANPLLVLAFDRKDWETGEQWFGGYLDAGIYLMNLLYALHFHKIAAIPLNWYASLEYTQELRDMLDMSASQVPVAVIACGYPKSDFKLVTSKRLPMEDVLKLV